MTQTASPLDRSADPPVDSPTDPPVDPPLSRRWWSYQRYALALGAAALALAALALTAAVAWSVWWALAALPAWKLASFAVEIARHYPRKVALTRRAQQAILNGEFSPDGLRGYCGDPCYRVVADEILRYKGLNAAERREVIRAHQRALAAERDVVVVVRHGAPDGEPIPWPTEGQRLPARVSVRFGAPSPQREDVREHEERISVEQRG